jgi:hypothetical protein
MTTWFLIIAAIIAANLPWLSERLFLVQELPRGKRAWQRFLEWFVLYVIVGGIALGLEYKTNGTVHQQDWEFYAVTLCLFLIFALPGFIYRHDLLQHLRHPGTRQKR